MDNNVFQNATLSLIDEAYTYVTSNKQAQDSNKYLDSFNFALEYRTLKVSSHRRAGHTTLINQLAFDVGSDIGRRYSTLVVAPSHDRALTNFKPGDMYYYDDDERLSVLAQLGQEYAEEYTNIVRREHPNNPTGKVLVATSFEHIGFHTRFFLKAQRDTIYKLTGETVNRFDLMLIDGSFDITPETLDKIIINFMDDVELFVLLQ